MFWRESEGGGVEWVCTGIIIGCEEEQDEPGNPFCIPNKDDWVAGIKNV